jgi:hypothetical protein
MFALETWPERLAFDLTSRRTVATVSTIILNVNPISWTRRDTMKAVAICPTTSPKVPQFRAQSPDWDRCVGGQPGDPGA